MHGTSSEPPRPLDRLHIRDLLLRCIVGIYPEEREKKQDVIINLTLHADLRRAARDDAIEETVDYKAIKEAVIALVERSAFRLIETLAERVAALALDHPLVEAVDVAIQKPGALRFARCSEVEITRRRRDVEEVSA